MKRLSLFMAMALVLVTAPFAVAKMVEVGFTWDTNIEPNVAGYGVFQRVEGGDYDYDQPIYEACEHAEAGCYTDVTNKVNELTHEFDTPDGQKVTYQWVARAKDTDENWSGDSNEVTFTFDLTPLPLITDLAAIYNEQTKLLTLTWTQNDSERIVNWRVYQSLNSPGGPYVEITNVVWDGSSTTITASHPITVPDHQTLTYYFVIVAFVNDGVASPNSNEVSVSFESAAPSNVMNLKIFVE